MKNKQYSLYLLILLCFAVVGVVLEYARIKKAYLHFIVYETQVETGLVARLAQNYLERNDLKGFEEFCGQSNRYSLKSDDSNLANDGATGKNESIFTRPNQTGLLSRVTLFDPKGNVLFDSWKEADKMENHSNRPEFLVMTNQTDSDSPFYSFERYSTTIQKKMFFCVTKFQANGSTYLLRTGNIVQAVEMAGNEYRQNLLKFSLFFLLTILLLILLFFSKIRHYRDQLFKISPRIESDSDRSVPRRPQRKKLAIDRIIRSIQGEMDYQNDQLIKERLLREAIFQSLVEGVVLLDKKGFVLDMNESARRLLDWKWKGEQGVSIFGVWRNSELMETFQQNDGDEQSVQKELEMDLPDGVRHFDVKIRSIRWGESSSGRLLLLYDLTRERRLENYRKEFVSNVSHEIKTPLTVVIGTVEALRDGAIDDKKVALAFLETLDVHAKRLYALVQDVLSLSNLETEANFASDRLESVSLLEPIETAISLCEPLARERRILISLENQTDAEPILPMNSSLMEQAFVNLIDNAIKYSDDGNRLDDSNGKASNKKVLIRLSNPEKKEFMIEVIDEGPGIPLKHQPRIFERFYRADESRSYKTGGSGLGLAIVKHIVQLHRGSIAVKNNPDRGCAFVLRFPIS